MLPFHLFALALAQSETLSNIYGHRQLCAGIYSKEDRPGPFNSTVTVNFPEENLAGNLSFTVFAYSDLESLGISTTTEKGYPGKHYICDEEAIAQQMCPQEDFGKIIINKYTNAPKHDILTQLVTLPTKESLTYDVGETGYYCVITFPLGETTEKYKARVHFMNAYGHIPGEDEPLGTLHRVLLFVYLAFFVAWCVQFVRFRQDALAVQKWITGLVGFMVVEQLVLCIYYSYFNLHGEASGVSKFLLVLVAILGAGRLSLTLFCVLIVSMGYSVVHERLGKSMKYCKMMGGALFVTSALYLLDSYYPVPNDDNRLIEFLFFFPSAVLVGIFYVWTLQSIGDTKQSLLARKQGVKARMYRNLWAVLLGSAISVSVFFALSIVIIATKSAKEVINNYWKSKWALMDGWPNIVYAVAIMLVAFIWRPTGDNRRFAMSTQLAQNEDDAEEFEIGSLDGSDVEADSAEPISGLHRDPAAQNRHHEYSRQSFDADSLRGQDLGEDRNQEWNRDDDDLVSAPGGHVKTT